jgi:hypothetical protein
MGMKLARPIKILLTRTCYSSHKGLCVLFCIERTVELIKKGWMGHVTNTKQTPWTESATELYRPSDRHFPAKLVHATHEKIMVQQEKKKKSTFGSYDV